MSQAPPAHRAIADYLAAAFGGEIKVMAQAYHDGLSVNVLVSSGAPEGNYLSCSTIGLSDRELVLDEEAMGFGVELCGALYADETPFVEMLADIAHEVQAGEWTIALGTILPDVIEPYFPGTQMQHLMLVHPFYWDETFGLFEQDARRTVWLQIIPISDSEYRLAEEQGVDVLEEKLEAAGADVFDLLRAPVV
ncbi:MAG: suppressor of fused domain protein [Hyphomonas sp.]